MTIKDIRSIGVLNAANGNYFLTPVFEGEQMPHKIEITKDDYNFIKGDTNKMKKFAIMKFKELAFIPQELNKIDCLYETTMNYITEANYDNGRFANSDIYNLCNEYHRSDEISTKDKNTLLNFFNSKIK
jgi:hypothetical protein